jgi:hypothetical protein
MSRKRSTTPPETSKITRSTTVAYARKQKDGEEPKGEAVADPKPDEQVAAAALDAETVIAPLAVPTSPPPMPAPDIARARADTMAMSPLNPVGAPPELPTHAPATPAVAPPASAVEDPTQMPGPRQVPGGNPDDAAPAPGRVPPGDSRSLRRSQEFALIYRQATFVISRCGQVGRRGIWRVVEYPTSAAASHAYAKECSRFVSEGFSDYRD